MSKDSTEQTERIIEQLGAEWGKLLSQAFIKIALLENKVSQISQENDELAKAIHDLNKKLHQAELNLLATQGKQVIDDAA